MTQSDREFIDQLSSHERNAVYFARALCGISFKKAFELYRQLGDQKLLTYVPPKKRTYVKKPYANAKECQCKYCGKHYVTTSRHRVESYCAACVRDGFDNVHRATGATSGWDKKPKERVAIVGGWRGRVVCGGFATNQHNVW